MENILLKNADLFCPSFIAGADVMISGGITKKIGKNLEFDPASTYVIDCSGKIVCPMFVDGNALIVGKLIYNENDFLEGGIGTVVGTIRLGGDVKNVAAHLEKAAALTSKGIDCKILTDGINIDTNSLSGDTSADMASVQAIIGVKTALNSQYFSRMGNPNLKVLSDLASICRSVSVLMNKKLQLMIHLERELRPGTDNLYWIDMMSIKAPYSFFKLIHAEEYPEAILEYAKRGCHVDFTAFGDKFDPRFEGLVDLLQRHDPCIDNFSISSDAFDLIEKKGNFAKYREPKSILNTIKVLHEEHGIDLEDLFKLVTVNPGKLIDENTGVIKEGVKCKALVMDKNFKIEAIINYKTTI